METPAIVFRTDTTKQLQLLKHPSLRDALTTAAKQYLSLPMAYATKVAFMLIHVSNGPDISPASEKALNLIGLTLINTKSFNTSDNCYFLTPEQAAVFGSELVHLYRSHKTNQFLSVWTMHGCEVEHDALCESVKNEPVLLYCIYRSVKSYYKGAQAKDISALLVSDSEDDRKMGLKKMSQASPYLEVMLRHAKCIGNLLVAMHNQHLYNLSVVEPEPERIHMPDKHHAVVTTVEQIPEELIQQVPALQHVVAYLSHQNSLSQFIQNYADILKTLYALRKYETNVQLLLQEKTTLGPSLFNLKFPANFAAELRKLANQTCGKDVNINHFIDVLNKLEHLLPAYNAMKSAFDKNVQAENTLQAAHSQVANLPASASTDLQSAVKMLLQATESGIACKNAFTESAAHFNGVYTSHIGALMDNL